MRLILTVSVRCLFLATFPRLQVDVIELLQCTPMLSIELRQDHYPGRIIHLTDRPPVSICDRIRLFSDVRVAGDGALIDTPQNLLHIPYFLHSYFAGARHGKGTRQDRCSIFCRHWHQAWLRQLPGVRDFCRWPEYNADQIEGEAMALCKRSLR